MAMAADDIARLIKQRFPDAEIKYDAVQRVQETAQPRFVSGDPPDVIESSALDKTSLVANGQLTPVTDLLSAPSFDIEGKTVGETLAAGTQDTAVRVLAPLSGPHRGQIGVRVGRVLVYVANREALASFVDAWNEAAELADQAFGPEMPPPVYKPRTSH